MQVRWLNGLALVAWAGLLGSPLAASPSELPEDTLRAAVQAILRGDCATGMGALTPIMADEAFASYPAEQRRAIYYLAAGCAFRQDRPGAAYDYMVIATDGPVDKQFWHSRFFYALRADKLDEAVTTIGRMAEGNGEPLNTLPATYIYDLNRKLGEKKATGPLRRVLALITGPSYRPVELPSPIDSFRKRYAELLLDGGDRTAAQMLVRQIETPSTLLTLSVDPRFGAMLPSFDARAAAELYLVRLDGLIAEHPESLELKRSKANWLGRLGRSQEALDLLQAARPQDDSGQNVSNFREKINWWWNSIASAQTALGHLDEAVSAMRQGGEQKEHGDLNVSQVINLSVLQIDIGRPRDALATLAAFDTSQRDFSPYGTMQVYFARGCAAAMLGDKALVQAAMTYIKAHRADAERTYRDFMLCTGDMAGAATHLIGELNDPERRAGAMLDIADYDAPLPGEPRGPVLSRLPELKARADVKAAVAKAGGIPRVHLQRE